MYNRRKLIVAFGAGALAAPFASFAQRQGKVHRIGFLRTSAPPESYLEAFRQGLQELGYIEGKNIAFEYRWAGGRIDSLPALAAELVSLNVDIIVADGGAAVRPARAATRTIPIVMASAGDPVGAGYIASLARPGGNVTGLTSMNINLGGKILDVLSDMVPKFGHVGVLGSTNPAADDLFLKNTEKSAHALKIKVSFLRVVGPEGYEGAFRNAAKERVQALVVRGTPTTSAVDRKQIIELAAKNRIPAIYDTRDWADNGGLITYGADRVDMYRRATLYVDKILKGAKPGDLPVEQPTKFEMVVNMKTAKALGLKIPNSILVQATEVIE